MPRRNRNAGGVQKQRARKHRSKKRKVNDQTAPLTPFAGHSAPRMRGAGAAYWGKR